MDLRAQRVEALVLRNIPYGESDAVVHLLVRGRGRIPAFARGARTSRKRFAGALEPFTRVEALLKEGPELWALREATVPEAHVRLRALELGALAASGLAPELAACARCGKEIAPGRAAFDPDAGGSVCAGCAGAGALPLGAGSRAALWQLRKGGLAAADAPVSADGSGRPADRRAFEEAAAQAAKPLAAFLRHHVGRPLASAGFLVQVGAPQ